MDTLSYLEYSVACVEISNVDSGISLNGIVEVVSTNIPRI